MKIRSKKRILYSMLLTGHTNRYRMSAEERMWLDVVPVGREFGSPDFERLSALDALARRTQVAADH